MFQDPLKNVIPEDYLFWEESLDGVIVGLKRESPSKYKSRNLLRSTPNAMEGTYRYRVSLPRNS